MAVRGEGPRGRRGATERLAARDEAVRLRPVRSQPRAGVSSSRPTGAQPDADQCWRDSARLTGIRCTPTSVAKRRRPRSLGSRSEFLHQSSTEGPAGRRRPRTRPIPWLPADGLETLPGQRMVKTAGATLRNLRRSASRFAPFDVFSTEVREPESAARSGPTRRRTCWVSFSFRNESMRHCPAVSNGQSAYCESDRVGPGNAFPPACAQASGSRSLKSASRVRAAESARMCRT